MNKSNTKDFMACLQTELNQQKDEPMAKTINNPNTFWSEGRKVQTLTVEFVTDMVPGAFHKPDDLMREIARHSYVKSVTLNEEEPEMDDLELSEMEFEMAELAEKG